MTVPPINPQLQDTESPAILQTRAWLGAYAGSRGPIIDLSQAAPPYSPPGQLLERLAAAAGSAETAKYGPVPGEYDLRAAYASDVSKTYGADIDPLEVSITAGCNQAFLVAVMLVAKRGDAVLLPAPWYFNHKMTLDMLGIEARPLICSTAFTPDCSVANSLIDRRVRAIVLVSPNNPTGAIYAPSVIRSFAQLCRDKGIWLILDETYRDFLREGSPQPHTLFDDELRDNVISLYSFSKSFALPGYRLGSMIYPARIAEHAIKVQDCVQICAARAGQIAVTWGLQHLDEWRAERRRELSRKQQALRSLMTQVHGWKIGSIGAYFAYVRHPFDGLDARIVAQRLAAENGILLIPGPYFGPGQEAYLRLSFGNLSPETMQSLPDRLML
jgi:aspartate/methionine/tyrosine aminotransferase